MKRFNRILDNIGKRSGPPRLPYTSYTGRVEVMCDTLRPQLIKSAVGK